MTTPAAVHSARSAPRPDGIGTASRSASARSTRLDSGVVSSAFVSPVTASARAGSSTAADSSVPVGSRSSTAVAWASKSPWPCRTSRVSVPSRLISSSQARCHCATASGLRRAPSSASWNCRISADRSAARSRTGPVRRFDGSAQPGREPGPAQRGIHLGQRDAE